MTTRLDVRETATAGAICIGTLAFRMATEPTGAVDFISWALFWFSAAVTLAGCTSWLVRSVREARDFETGAIHVLLVPWTLVLIYRVLYPQDHGNAWPVVTLVAFWALTAGIATLALRRKLHRDR